MELFLDSLFSVIPASLIIITYILAAYLIRRSMPSSVALAWLAGITLIGALVWFGAALLVGNAFADCCFEQATEPRYVSLYYRTLGLPFNLCYLFPQVGSAYGSSFCTISGIVVLPVGLFVLGLTAFLLGRPRARAR